jgi:hypothetical protein
LAYGDLAVAGDGDGAAAAAFGVAAGFAFGDWAEAKEARSRTAISKRFMGTEDYKSGYLVIW